MVIYEHDYKQTVIVELSVAEVKLVAQLLHLHLTESAGNLTPAGDKLLETLRQQTNDVSDDATIHSVWSRCPFNTLGERPPRQMKNSWYIPIDGDRKKMPDVQQ